MSKIEKIEQQLDKEVSAGMHRFAEEIAKHMATPDKALVSPKMQLQKIERELSHELKVMKKSCKEGFSLCMKALKELASHDETVDAGALKADLQRAFAQFDSVEHAQYFGLQLLEGKTWAELLGLQSSTLQMLYQGAKSIFEAKHYADAQSAFSFLATIDPRQYQFWLGLGLSASHTKYHEIAINAYAAASMRNPSSPWPHIYAADCFESDKEYAHAVMALEEAVKVNSHSEHKDQKLETDLSQRISVLKHKI